MAIADASRAVVLDTNVALDLLLFRDPATAELHADLQQGRLRWLVLPGMRDELARVLDYPQLLRWRQARGHSAAAVLAEFDARSHSVEAVPAAPVRCADPDDQPFIDLAVAHGALLLSKDHAVLAPRARLAALGVTVLKQLLTNRHLPARENAVATVSQLAHSHDV